MPSNQDIDTYVPLSFPFISFPCLSFHHGTAPEPNIQVDSARVYRNEGPCSQAMKKSGIPRSEIFFTSKVPPRAMGYEATKSSINSSFSQTGLDYIDL